jgi:DNA topoisomerase-3
MGEKELVLAEKPSVGRDIARVLGSPQINRYYCEGPTYIVTWALGHLVELAEPAAYNPAFKRWTTKDLPILPNELKEVVMDSTKEHFKQVAALLKRSDVKSVVIATDAGREGELVARSILKLANWKKEIKRLWISSQTDEAIKTGFATLKEGKHYDNLYAAAKARSAADWYVGLNVTRALTCRHDAKLSAGRVQTPTLALIVEREKEREAFVGRFYYSVRANFGPFSASFQNGETTQIESEEKADEIMTHCDNKEAKVISVIGSEHLEQSPLAYDLTELQRDANAKLGFSAKETLDVLQQLYERHKIVTYPRTDSRYITSDIVPTLPKRLAALEATPFGQIASLYLEHGFKEDLSRFVSETKVTDHHAIIPTETKVDLTRLNKKEQDLWTLIGRRFLEILSEPYIYKTNTVTLQIGTYTFATNLRVVVQNGYRDIGRLEKESEELLVDDSMIPQIGATFKVEKIQKRRYTVNPPERYTEGTLLSAMENAGRFVEDSELKKSLSGGLGTPATRAEIIEKLIQNHYIIRQERSLVPTAKGIELIRIVPEELKTPELTAQWENRLQAIAEGEQKDKDFIEDIKNNARLLVNKALTDKVRFTPEPSEGKTCPTCFSAMLKFLDEKDDVHFVCQKLSCSYEEAHIKRLKVAPVKQKIVKTQALGSGKKVVVVKKAKSEKVNIANQWETKIEVVRPSKLRAKRDNFSYQPKQEKHDEHTTTFADLIAASQKRNKRN